MGLLGNFKEKLTFLSKKKPASALEELVFNPSEDFTLGVEIELQIVDKDSLNLSSTAEEVLKLSNHEKVKKEFYLSTVEINTGICKDAHHARTDLEASMAHLKQSTASMPVEYSTTGCHPFSKYSDCIITPSERYNELVDRNQWLTRRMTVYGLHVHVGMKSANDAIRFSNFFINFIPHLLALSGSSPFWQGEDTGLSSCRPTTYEALPTAGLPYTTRDWAEFKRLYRTLLKSGSIKGMKDLWWDIRPSPGYGTMEIRVCDGLATIEETIAIVAFIHSLALWFNDNGHWLEQVPLPPRWILRENKWRAMRHGLNADIITATDGSCKSVRQDILEWLEKLAPYSRQNDYGKYFDFIKVICEKGNSAFRQREVFQKTGSLHEVVRHNVREFNEGYPIWDI